MQNDLANGVGVFGVEVVCGITVKGATQADAMARRLAHLMVDGLLRYCRGKRQVYTLGRRDESIIRRTSCMQPIGTASKARPEGWLRHWLRPACNDSHLSL